MAGSVPPGYTDTGKQGQCPACGGRGYAQIQDLSGVYVDQQCPQCNGTGFVEILIPPSGS
jgi:DnaJ-class molecular chaperone